MKFRSLVILKVKAASSHIVALQSVFKGELGNEVIQDCGNSG